MSAFRFCAVSVASRASDNKVCVPRKGAAVPPLALSREGQNPHAREEHGRALRLVRKWSRKMARMLRARGAEEREKREQP